MRVELAAEVVHHALPDADRGVVAGHAEQRRAARRPATSTDAGDEQELARRQTVPAAPIATGCPPSTLSTTILSGQGFASSRSADQRAPAAIGAGERPAVRPQAARGPSRDAQRAAHARRPLRPPSAGVAVAGAPFTGRSPSRGGRRCRACRSGCGPAAGSRRRSTPRLTSAERDADADDLRHREDDARARPGSRRTRARSCDTRVSRISRAHVAAGASCRRGSRPRPRRCAFDQMPR